MEGNVSASILSENKNKETSEMKLEERMRTIKLLAVAVITILICATTVNAQGFSSLIEKLDQLEAKLAELENSQKQDVANLKKELANSPKGANNSESQAAIKKMSSKLDAMNAELTEVKTGSEKIQANYDMLMAELLELTYALKQTMKEQDATGHKPAYRAEVSSPKPMSSQAPKSEKSAKPISNGEPSLSYQPYGYIKLDGSYDQNLTSHGNFAMWVKPKSYEKDDEQLNMTANQSRLGFKIDSQNYGEYKLHGQFEVDLYASVSGGVAENKGMFQLRHAFFSIEKGNTKLLAGQYWDLYSPLNPSTINYPVLWGAGNTGYRRAQITLAQSFSMGTQTTGTLSGGAFRTIGSDLTPTLEWSLEDSSETSDGEDDGTDAGIPTVQGRLDINHSFASGSKLLVGVSGLWGQLKAETNRGNNNTYESWGVCGHMKWSWSKFGLAGEYYSGSNLGSYFGGILNSSTIDGTNAQGGWGFAWIKTSPKTKLGFGVGNDTAKEEDISSGSRLKNQSIFGNINYSIVKNATVGLELSQWQTEYKDGETEKSFRAQTAFTFSF